MAFSVVVVCFVCDLVYTLYGAFFKPILMTCFFMFLIYYMVTYLYCSERCQDAKLTKGSKWDQRTGTCFIQKIYAPSSSLLQGKHLPFSPSPLRLNIFRLFAILSLTQLYRYTPEIFLFSTATFKYIYLRQIGQE